MQKAEPHKAGINERDFHAFGVSLPRTCVIPELWEFVVKQDVLLARSVVHRSLFFPPDAILNCPNGMLFLQDRAGRREQLDMLLRMEGYYHCLDVIERQNEAMSA